MARRLLFITVDYLQLQDSMIVLDVDKGYLRSKPIGSVSVFADGVNVASIELKIKTDQ